MGRIKLTYILFFCLSPYFIYSQTDKQINKCIKIYEKNDTKGVNKLEKLMNSNDGFPTITAWETLVKMKYRQYHLVNEYYNELNLSSKENNGVKIDSITIENNKLLKNENKTEFINLCRLATIMSTSNTADLYLRKFLVDFEPDTSVNSEALKHFIKAEKKFVDENYEAAKKEYKAALHIDSNYYKANLYLGDTFWASKKPDSAILFFNKAITLEPNLLEPRKYLIDVLMEQKLYFRAKKECLNAMFVYPSNAVKIRYQKALKLENKYINEHKIRKRFFANNIIKKNQKSLKGPFETYRNAKHEVAKYCDIDGIISSNELTSDKYLEVYSWRRFIEEHEAHLPNYYLFALKMIKEGYFDCYVLTTLFHVDIYPQLKHFMSIPENRIRTEEYINKYLITTYK